MKSTGGGNTPSCDPNNFWSERSVSSAADRCSRCDRNSQLVKLSLSFCFRNKRTSWLCFPAAGRFSWSSLGSLCRLWQFPRPVSVGCCIFTLMSCFCLDKDKTNRKRTAAFLPFYSLIRNVSYICRHTRSRVCGFLFGFNSVAASLWFLFVNRHTGCL